jgi:outer membrane lipoprotein-sorting protein
MNAFRTAGRTCAVLLWIAFAPQTALPQARPSVQEVVYRIDRLYRADSSYAMVEMEIVNPHWQRTLRMRAWSEGTQKTFIRILAPAKERGTASLRIGSEMWNYLPTVNRVIRIPPSMMMGSWMGSDFTNDDLVKEFTFASDYTFRYASVEHPDAATLYIDCVPKEGRPIVWGRVLLAVDAGTLLPKSERYYDEEGRLMRTMTFSDVKLFGNRRVPAVLELVPENKPGQKTIVRYLEATFDAGVPPETFTQRNLRATR